VRSSDYGGDLAIFKVTLHHSLVDRAGKHMYKLVLGCLSKVQVQLMQLLPDSRTVKQMTRGASVTLHWTAGNAHSAAYITEGAIVQCHESCSVINESLLRLSLWTDIRGDGGRLRHCDIRCSGVCNTPRLRRRSSQAVCKLTMLWLQHFLFGGTLPGMTKESMENAEQRSGISVPSRHRELQGFHKVLYDAVGELSPGLSEEAFSTLCSDAKFLELSQITLNFRDAGTSVNSAAEVLTHLLCFVGE